MRIERVIALFVLAIFCFTASPTLAAVKKNWFVTKDKRGICKVVKAKARTHTTIAGPFVTKREAVESKEKECGSSTRSHKSMKKSIHPAEPSSQTGETGMQPGSPGQPSPQGPPSSR